MPVKNHGHGTDSFEILNHLEDASWGKKSKADPLRGFVNDGEEVPTARRRTAQQKNTMLELMLGQIANYCQIISRSTLVKGSTSLDSIWQAIRLHFGFQTTGAHFIDFDSIVLEPDERPEDLYQRLMAFVEDCLLKANELTHHSDAIQEDEELSPTVEKILQRIIVPRQVLEGLLTALHIKLQHPSSHQLRSAANRYFFALDMDKAIDHVTKSCHPCAALKKTPKSLIEQSTNPPPDAVGTTFAADAIKRARQLILVLRECATSKSLIEQSTNPPPDAVGTTFAADAIKRARQLILVLRECATSYTKTLLLSDECKDTLRDALIRLCVEMRPLDGPPAVIRTDPAPGFKALTEDKFLHQQRITLEIGRVKNPNKNPVAEKAIQELENELLRLDPLGGSISSVTLAIATATLNARIRS
ncbi:hypothetical protein QZH41_008577, partial [Actinostola sp. cb2023]